MDRREKQRKFHQAIIDMLYPPPPRRQQQEGEEEDPTKTTTFFHENHIKDRSDPELLDSPSSSSDDKDEEGEPGPHKLTRAQRKRLRKKKLKESTSSGPQRRKIIGPLLPSDSSVAHKPEGGNGSFGEDHIQAVQQNAAVNQSQNAPADSEDCNAQKEGKLKRRRMAKKLAREKIRPSHLLDECDEDGESSRE